MSTWTLILIVNSFWSTAPSVTSVEGYSTESNCIVAGNALLKDKDMKLDTYKCIKVI